MADCFSLPNAAELVENEEPLFNHVINEFGADGKVWFDKRFIRDYVSHLKLLIEQLLAENAKLKAEHDAAVEDIIIACRGENTLCGVCGNKDCEFVGDNLTYCYKCSKFEWRGVTDTNVGSKKEADDATDNASDNR